MDNAASQGATYKPGSLPAYFFLPGKAAPGPNQPGYLFTKDGQESVWAKSAKDFKNNIFASLGGKLHQGWNSDYALYQGEKAPSEGDWIQTGKGAGSMKIWSKVSEFNSKEAQDSPSIAVNYKPYESSNAIQILNKDVEKLKADWIGSLSSAGPGSSGKYMNYLEAKNKLGVMETGAVNDSFNQQTTIKPPDATDPKKLFNYYSKKIKED